MKSSVPSRLLAATLAAYVVLAMPLTAGAASLTPSTGAAAGDEERTWSDGCFGSQKDTHPNLAYRCTHYGDPKGKFVVALVGDSHASAWFPAIERVARDRGWRLEVFVKASCVPVDMLLYSNYLRRNYRECQSFQKATIEHLGQARYRADLLIVTASHISVFPGSGESRSFKAKVQAYADMIRKLPASKKIILADSPYAGRDIPACVRSHPSAYGACAIRGWRSYNDLDVAAGQKARVPVIDIVNTAAWCKGRAACPTVVGGHIAFRDSHHLTATFARHMAPTLDAMLKSRLPGLNDRRTPNPTPSPSPTPDPTPSTTPDPTPLPSPTPDPTPSTTPDPAP